MRSLGFIAAMLLAGLTSASAVNERVLYPFTLYNGVNPTGLIFDRAGNIYGTTAGGGGYLHGAVFELSQSGTGWTEKTLYSFTGGGDGSAPIGNLIFDAAGNLYGTATAGGTGCSFSGCGVVFELSPGSNGWTETVLYTFTGGTDGQSPIGGVVSDGHGNLYGAASYGGNTSCNCGTVYRLGRTTNGWKFSVLHSFSGGSDGAVPNAGLFVQSGNLYGTALTGGNPKCTGFPLPGCGTAFSLTPVAGGKVTFQVIYSFGQGATDGEYPSSSLIADSSGNLYGTTLNGGSIGGGTVFKLSPANGNTWQESVLYSFGSAGDGFYPSAPLIFDKSGNLYGTTQYGGGLGAAGMAFRLTPRSNGVWVETILHAFTGGPDGQYPSSGLIIGPGPGLYGSTSAGGSVGSAGVVYEITK